MNWQWIVLICSDLWTSWDLLYSSLIWLVLTCEQAETYCTVLWHDLIVLTCDEAETYFTVLWWTDNDLFWLVHKLRHTDWVQSSDMTCSDLWTSWDLLYSPLIWLNCSDLWTSWDLLYSPLIWLVLPCEQTKTYCTFLWYDLFWLVNKLWLTVQSSDELAMMLSLNGLNLISSTTPACPHTWGVFGSTRPLYKTRVQSSITEISIS